MKKLSLVGQIFDPKSRRDTRSICRLASPLSLPDNEIDLDVTFSQKIPVGPSRLSREPRT